MLRFKGVRGNGYFHGIIMFPLFFPQSFLHLFSCSKDRFTKYNLQRKMIPHFLASCNSMAPCPFPNHKHHRRFFKLCFPFTTLTSQMLSHLFPHLPLVWEAVCSCDCPSLSYTVCLPLHDHRIFSS